MKTGCATAMPCPISSHQVLILWEKVEELLIRWLMNSGCRSSLNRREAFDKRRPHPQLFIKSTRLPLKQGGRCWRGKAGGLGGEGADAADGSSLCFRTYRLVYMPTVLQNTDWCACSMQNTHWSTCSLYFKTHRLVCMPTILKTTQTGGDAF